MKARVLGWALVLGGLAGPARADLGTAPEWFPLRAFGLDMVADRAGTFAARPGRLEVRGYGHLWTKEPSYDVRAEGSSCRVRLRTRLRFGPGPDGKTDGGELIVGFSANRLEWVPDRTDALTFRIGCDPADSVMTAIRSRMYGKFEATGSAFLVAETWSTVELVLTAKKLAASVDGTPVVEANLLKGAFPLQGHVGVLGYRKPLTEVEGLVIDAKAASWLSGP